MYPINTLQALHCKIISYRPESSISVIFRKKVQQYMKSR